MATSSIFVGMRMLIDDIGSIAVTVSDVKKSKKWYVEKLGFKLQDDEDHWVVVTPPGSPVGLHLCEVEKLEPGNTGITLRTDNLEATYQTLKRNGVQFSRELAPSEWDKKMKYAMLKDLDGNEFWLISKSA